MIISTNHNSLAGCITFIITAGYFTVTCSRACFALLIVFSFLWFSCNDVIGHQYWVTYYHKCSYNIVWSIWHLYCHIVHFLFIVQTAWHLVTADHSSCIRCVSWWHWVELKGLKINARDVVCLQAILLYCVEVICSLAHSKWMLWRNFFWIS